MPRKSKRYDGSPLTGRSARLLAALVVMTLSACDSGPATVVADDQVASAEPSAPGVTTQSGAADYASAARQGPHGAAYDPHVNLTPDKHVQVALQHLAEGRAPLAMETLNTAIETYPENAGLRGVRGSPAFSG